MNKQRRRKLSEISGVLTDMYWELNLVLAAEEDAFDNMPDNLKESARGQCMEEGIYLMNEWMNTLEEIFNGIDNMVEVIA